MLKSMTLAIALAFTLAACETRQVDKAALTGCDGYERALSSLVPARLTGQLTQPQITRVDTVRRIVDPICNSTLPGWTKPTLPSTLAALAAAAGELATIKNEVK